MMNRRELLSLMTRVGAVAIFGPLGGAKFLLAADSKADMPITVTKSDGTLVRGKITAYDKDKITIDTIGKPKEPSVSTDIFWDDIKRISNGLKRENGLQKWKLEHHDSLCMTCHGDGKVFCSTCHGTGHDPSASAGCPTCKGEAQMDCSTKKCVNGIIPCTNPKCLKLTDGGWVKKPDGVRWKRFNGNNGGWTEWSEHHAGQIVEKVDGQWQNLGICPVCMGSTTLVDPACRGTSKCHAQRVPRKPKIHLVPINATRGWCNVPRVRGMG